MTSNKYQIESNVSSIAKLVTPKRLLIGCGVFALFIIGSNSFKILRPTQRGVMEVLGVAQKGVLSSGLQFKFPFISRIELYEVKELSSVVVADAATKDQQKVDGTVEVYFRIDAAKLDQTRIEIGIQSDITNKVQSIGQEAFKEATATKTAEELITQRSDLKATFDGIVKVELEKVGLTFTRSTVTNFAFSKDYMAAIEAKQIEEQQVKQAEFAAQKKEKEAQGLINLAKGRAEAVKLEASAEAEKITKLAAAQAEAARIQMEQLRLSGSDQLLQLEAIRKWNGQVPTVNAGDKAIPFINIK